MELLRRSKRCRTALLTCLLSTLVLFLQLLVQLWLEWIEDANVPVHHHITNKFSLNDVDDLVLVWWTPFTGNTGSFIECGNLKCFITEDRRFQHHSKFQMFLFYGSNLEIWDLPLPRKDQHIWSLFHEESPKNIPFLSHQEGISLFNFTATFSRFSDVPLTLQYVQSFESLTDLQYYVPLSKKNELLQYLSPVLYVQSDCDTPLDRDKYVQNLMRYISVDSYGTCLHNKDLPESMSNPMESMTSEEFLHFTAQYKFTIAFENAVCEDYITEKLWRPLTVGSVPIYLGSPSVQDWLPSQNSAVLAINFSSPKELASHISVLNSNDEEYLSLLSHKESVISNIYQKAKMNPRLWGSLKDNRYHFIDQFECQMCIKAHHNSKANVQRKVANQEVYNCPKPISSVTGQEDPTNPWLYLWKYSKCEASLLAEIIQGGHMFVNQTLFNQEVLSRMRESDCT
ncbi:alpha-(1,3)-fucosyltransferase 10 [Frankliniella occidentalis]|uniref:Fucosyltransferase n=1 Tax=Frankliniella occidentalis TaxID=133901 RepID=A0A6J1RT70_FRAOC|nr:alpha-(1,3)-fucosyltransferase 10 [Frankliniella occidentalis]